MLENLPVLLLKKLVLLPYQEVRLELNSELSKKVIDISLEYNDKKLLVICPNNVLETNPMEADLPYIGVLAKIKYQLVLPSGNYRVVLTGVNRVNVKEYRNYKDDINILEAIVKRIYIDSSNKEKDESIVKSLKTLVKKYMDINPDATNSIITSISNIDDLDMLTDIITNYMPFEYIKKVQYMNEFDYIKRANNLIKDINIELNVIDLETKIDDQINSSLEKEQRNYIIKQKINALNEELGINRDKQSEISMYQEKINMLNISDKSKIKLLDEVNKYSYVSESNPDSSVIRNYLDTVISLPWNNLSKDEIDLKKIKKSLDKSHYGLDNIKKRILEYIAISKNTSVNAPIICLVGPPGTGKTTICMSIANSLNREFYKISVGGLNDSSELIGHKRTYLGSSPGKIIQGIKKCGTKNPLILIDEVDKIVSDFKGDPAAVLLNILDSSQNKEFIDNYIEEPFDLSNVLFILTANDIRLIPPALRDRLEVIQVNSYTEFEKIDIAKKYLLPKIIIEYNSLKYKISDDNLLIIINEYTKESGIRELERCLKKIIRSKIIDNISNKNITKEEIYDILGPIKYDIKKRRIGHVGSVTTLGVTPYGGVMINLESILVPGSGKIMVTGNVEDAIKETSIIALNHILSFANIYGIDSKKINKYDIHINALDHHIKKDGTSGGIAIATSIISLLLNKEVDPNICFSGEITLHGDVCKVGGIKEKIIGAFNNGYKTIYIPKENINDLAIIPINILEKINVKCVNSYTDIFNDLFKKINQENKHSI